MEGGRRKRSASSHSTPTGIRHKERRVDPGIEYRLKKIAKEAREKNEETIDNYLKFNNLTDIVSPYIYDNSQMSILRYILGNDNADSIAALNALNYSGIINTDCPPPKEPWKTESFKNILTGKMECREPIPKRTQISGPTVCPSGGDPMAIQKYVDLYGRGHCIRPVVSGEFSCPPKSDPTKTKLKVLKNNVGICVKDPKLTRKKPLLPKQIVYPNAIDPDALRFLDIYNDERLTLQQVGELNNIFRRSKNLRKISDLKAGLSGDTDYEALITVLDNIHHKKDIDLAKLALGNYLREYIANNTGGNMNNDTVRKLLSMGGLEQGLEYNMTK